MIPLDDGTIQKAKACQEMIMYEKVEEADQIDPQHIIESNRVIQEQFAATVNHTPNLAPSSELSKATEEPVRAERQDSGDSFMKM
jgi:hypothetical protein